MVVGDSEASNRSIMSFAARLSDPADLPEELGQLVNVEFLSVHNNRLKNLPEAIHRMPRLRVLIASVNRIKELPLSISHCPKLQYLDVSYNLLQELVPGFGRLGISDGVKRCLSRT